MGSEHCHLHDGITQEEDDMRGYGVCYQKAT